MSSTYSLLRELRRRKVFRGAAIYLVAAWLVLQVLDVIAEPAGLPVWTLRVALYIAIIGFPLAVFLGWRYELGEHGLVVTRAAQRGDDDGRAGLVTRDYVAIAAMTIVSIAVAWRVLPAVIEETPQPGIVEEISILPNSIAVIPFREPGATSDGFLADGLVDTVTFMLAQVDGLVVTARTSAYAFKGSEIGVPDIARQLRVSYILEGSVQQIDNRVQIIASLIEASSGLEVWSNRFFREVSDIFAIQDEIAGEVVVALGRSIDLGDDELAEGYRPNLAAFEEVINGRNANRDRTVDGVLRAEQHFKRAIELDAGYAVAYVELAANYAQREDLGLGNAAQLMRPLLEKALELDPLSAEAYTILALVLRAERRMDEIEPMLLKAIELNANLVDARIAYASWLMMGSRHDESLAQARVANELDPQNVRVRHLLALATWNVAQAEKAISIARQAIRDFPSNPLAYIDLSRWYAQTGELGRAMLYTQALYRLDPDSRDRSYAVCQAWSQLGADEELSRCYEEFLQRFPDDLEARKQQSAWHGDYAEAIRIAEEHATLEPWSKYRQMQLAFFLEADRQYQRVIGVVSAAYPELLAAEPAVNSFTTWPGMMLAHALTRTGDSEHASALLAALERATEQMRLERGSGWTLGIEPAQIAAVRGQNERAIELLGQAVDGGWAFYSAAIHIDPKFDGLRDDPRYRAVTQQLQDQLAEHRRWYEENRDAPLY